MPPGYSPEKRYCVVYILHGIGGSKWVDRLQRGLTGLSLGGGMTLNTGAAHLELFPYLGALRR